MPCSPRGKFLGKLAEFFFMAKSNGGARRGRACLSRAGLSPVSTPRPHSPPRSRLTIHRGPLLFPVLFHNCLPLSSSPRALETEEEAAGSPRGAQRGSDPARGRAPPEASRAGLGPVPGGGPLVPSQATAAGRGAGLEPASPTPGMDAGHLSGSPQGRAMGMQSLSCSESRISRLLPAGQSGTCWLASGPRARHTADSGTCVEPVT